ncbi:MAG: hypothetical protein GEU83_12040 [Pseudonocardiaceae bacterium]|nr:hypothetical protein [Pseudonocardiaceae bacterium]
MDEQEFAAALDELAEYERRIAESDRLAQNDSLAKAEVLDRLYRDQRWVAERNAERAKTATTARGGRPVDPASRSQFSTWVRGRYKRIAPQHVYRLLDAVEITRSFLTTGEISPTAENQVRPLKVLTKVAHGSGARIPEVWDIAVKLADGDQPTHAQVREAIAEWKRLHLTQTQERKERAIDRAEQKRRKAEAAWRDLLKVGSTEHINAFLDVIRKDVEHIDETGARP